jgi:transketolase
MTALCFGGVVRYRPDEPWWPERDRVILSKGHAAPLLYSVLTRAGYAPVEELNRFRQRGSGLHGHPIQATFPGVEMTSGSLGQGLSFGLGHVLAGRVGWTTAFLSSWGTASAKRDRCGKRQWRQRTTGPID